MAKSLVAGDLRSQLLEVGLGDEGPLYDPQVNYERVRDKWWDWDREPDPVVQSTRTVDIPAPDADIPVNDDSGVASGVQ